MELVDVPNSVLPGIYFGVNPVIKEGKIARLQQMHITFASHPIPSNHVILFHNLPSANSVQGPMVGSGDPKEKRHQTLILDGLMVSEDYER